MIEFNKTLANRVAVKTQPISTNELYKLIVQLQQDRAFRKTVKCVRMNTEFAKTKIVIHNVLDKSYDAGSFINQYHSVPIIPDDLIAYCRVEYEV